MHPQGKSIGSAVAAPTKDFFVRMLTRDIELPDALLDLLDNCVDGIVRSGGPKPDPTKPYEGYSAEITLMPTYFVIEDNCGGIPIEIAKQYAFAMGRPPDANKAASTATVGMYGIGMKRAIFKLGTTALVESRNDEGFVVEFTQDWMRDDKWDDLPMYELAANKLMAKGTRVEVYELNDEVKAAFSNAEWVDEFRKLVARHFSLIIGKGFSVRIGSKEELDAGVAAIAPEPFKLIRTTANAQGVQIAPYVYAGKLGPVEVEIFAGLYRQLLSEDEAEEEEETRGVSDDAGWTVACNDRVVIWKDKTRLTGWGEASVPNYHGQFIAITGIVLLRSQDPKQLPLTTTKRGIDASSNVYSEVKDLMREATKNLTSFTNKWKKFPARLEEIYQQSEYVDLDKLQSASTNLAATAVRKLPGIKKFEPKYPEPEQAKTSVRVSFTAEKTAVATLAKHFFGDQTVKAGEVGEAAFTSALEGVKKRKK
jgi:Histidine kinase-, DNA gyrase B-, and HSP90-like ATPase